MEKTLAFASTLFQHTAARRRLTGAGFGCFKTGVLFQHTAARRRLNRTGYTVIPHCRVSTHSRPKAADKIAAALAPVHGCFNTQPPEGG